MKQVAEDNSEISVNLEDSRRHTFQIYHTLVYPSLSTIHDDWINTFLVDFDYESPHWLILFLFKMTTVYLLSIKMQVKGQKDLRAQFPMRSLTI